MFHFECYSPPCHVSHINFFSCVAPPPTESPAPSVDSFNTNTGSGGSGGVSGGENAMHSGSKHDLCTLCTDNQLDRTKSVIINEKDVTCGSIENMFTTENLLMGSENCNAVQKMYQDTCCFDSCFLCELPSGEFLDVQDILLDKGGYSATCSQVNNLLSANSKNDKICSDAKEQLAGDCCYKQCTLCDAGAGETTSWYATVNVEEIQSTCLGLDFMLRTEQVSSGSDRCSNTRGVYAEHCCYIPPSNPCQLCEADGKVYSVNSAKSVSTIERQSTTSCAWINDDLAKISNDDKQCTDGKGSYFGQCCDLTGVIGVADEGEEGGKGVGSISGDGPNSDAGNAASPSYQSNTTTVDPGNKNVTAVDPQDNFWNPGGSEWDPSEWNPPSGSASTYAFTKESLTWCYLCLYCVYIFL